MTAPIAEPTTDLVLLILVQARDLIAEPGGWTQGCFSRDAQNERVEFTSPDARSWCGQRAIYLVEHRLKASHDRGALGQATDEVRKLLDRVPPGGHFPHWQDQPERMQAEVVSAFEALVEYRRLEIDRGTSSMEALEEAIRDQPFALMGE